MDNHTFIGFDLEIAREFPDIEEEQCNWLTVEPPLGITCASLASSADTETERRVYIPDNLMKLDSDDPALREMDAQAARVLAQSILDLHTAGALIVTWNGLGFDFPVLARACDDPQWTRKLAQVALDHCDMGFAMLCSHGYMVGLNTAAKAFGLAGKTEGMSGGLAPLLWNKPERPLKEMEAYSIKSLNVMPGSKEARILCCEYVVQDAITTRDVYAALLREESMAWITQKGVLTRKPWFPLIVNGHIATVKEALILRVPDTSWMSVPTRPRSAYVGWAHKILEKQ